MNRLAEAVVARQEELGLSDAQVQGVGGPAPATLRRVRLGKPVTAAVRRRLERALQWQPGIADAYLAAAPEVRNHEGPHVCSAASLTDEELVAELARRLATRHEPPVS